MKKLTFSLLTIFTLAFNSQAQELETILLAKDDAAKLTEAYINPTMKGLIYSSNSGWYHTAKVHKKFGFDITIGASGSFAPSKDDIFDLTKLGLSSNTTFTNNTSPTIAAEENVNGTTVTFNTSIDTPAGPQNVSADFTMPGGESIDITPAPMVQVGIGLPFKLEAMVRFVPKVGSDDVKAGLFGIGLKKEITDWFGPMDKTPLHISLLAAYTNMTVDYEIGNVSGQVATTNGLTEFKLNSYTVQAIASLNLPVINFYGGVGYNGGTTKLNMLGDYTLTYQTNTTPSVAVQENVSNPLALSNTTGGFNATIGTRLSLGFFKIFGSYTLQEQNTLNAGIAFSFR
ncbi:conserved exported protein of unknown function [Tenacibaculum sp. 190130A14a]|uniref:Outer membrane protein beta-barrel domain-containing protein n=1 Tax=Tenacibaculum polynesiense TaxID=3137857 RepID=A0ABM9PDD1_9FLAO